MSEVYANFEITFGRRDKSPSPYQIHILCRLSAGTSLTDSSEATYKRHLTRIEVDSTQDLDESMIMVFLPLRLLFES